MPANDVVTTDDNRRLATAIGLYVLGEKTLGGAADHADISKQRMKMILSDRGVDLRLGPRDAADAKSELETLENL
jgi:predicted HTH domain antitoxin